MNKIYTTKGGVYAFLIVFLGALAIQVRAAVKPIAPPGQPRYLSMSIMNVEDDDSYLPLMERAAKAGINSFVLNVNWDHIYRKRGSAADWSQIDKEAELAKRLGCKIMLRVWVARHSDGKEGAEGWWPDDVRPVSGDGVRHKDLNGFSFSATEAVNEANAFVREAMQHFRPRQQAGEIVLVTVVANNASEIGYSVDAQNPVNEKNELQLFDYSYHSKIEFRTWLQAKYQTLAGLNKAWNSDFSRFSDIHPPYIKGDVWSGHYGNAGMDWYLFRHYVLKRTINGFIDTIKGVDSGYRYYNDVGSCYDGLSQLRGTFGFTDLGIKTDGLKVNDGPYYPHRFAADLLRSNMPGKIIGNELGHANGIDVGVWRDFVNETYEHGADWLNFFGIDRDFNFVHHENLIREMADKWLKTPVQTITPTQTVTYTLSEAIRQGTNKVQEKWRDEYAKTQKPIRVLLIDDVFDNKPVENLPPQVSKALPDQQGKVGQSFTYEIPAGTFTDPDGTIASITAKGLPTGITLTDRKFAGSPTTSGEFVVTVTARDDKGAEVSTQFKFKVDPKESNGANQPPVVNKIIPDQQGKVGQSFTYEIAGGTFTDPDGTIASLSAKGLPEGIILTDNKLLGIPTVSGEYGVKITARDNQGAEVSAQFKFRINPGDSSGANQLPIVSKAVPDQQGKVGQSFAYEIAAGTFTDPDGIVASITAKGLPAGITLTDRKLSGSPTTSGDFTVTVTARDDKSAEVSTQFKFKVDPKESENVLPLVRKTIPDQQGKVGENFDYTISKETFFDPDGPIIDISIKGQPDGLSHSGWRLSGTPTVSGEFIVTVTARDSRDAIVATQFKITISPKESVNQPPLVNKIIPDQQGKIGQAFVYEIAPETFTDPDGTITGISATGLPGGVSLSGWKLTGTPTVSGEYGVKITARDNQGAEVSAQFKFRINPGDSSGANQLPIVSKAVPDQQGKVGQSFAYEIAAGTFTDPDGIVASITAKGLPAGITLTDRKLSGSPTTSGDFTVTVTARDDKSAEVSTQFKFKVDPKESENVLPLVRKTIPDQQGKVGENFDYTISKETFFDPDGPIIDISIKGQPDGLSHSGWRLSGTPTVSGEFIVTVTARDSRDAIVATQFKITISPKESVNQPPQVSKSIPDQQGKVEQPFTYEISTSTFTDPDGTIASITAKGLPAGITLTDRKLSGSPTTSGDFTVTVTARDDKSAEVSTQFKFKVDPKESENVLPLVRKTIPDQQGKVGENFDYTISKETFFDPDGPIIDISVKGQPDGLSHSGWRLSGTPTVSGEFIVTVTARDSRDAIVATQFKITISPKEGANQPPVVTKIIPDQQGKVGQSFGYEIAVETFTDPDGTIASITANGLPAGVTLTDRKFAGNPTTSGDFTVTVTARDDKGAEVSTQFKFKVAEKDIENKPPLVSKVIPNQQGRVGQAFDYEIAKETFTDPDGTIAGISATGLPNGLSLNGWKITGSPLISGEFGVTVTARDNQGAEVSAQFKITVDKAPTAPTANIFSLFQAGNFLTRRFLHYIVDGDTLRGEDAKSIVNILVSPKTGAVGSYVFKMEGPYSVGSTDNTAPYGVFGDNGGVVFTAGRYTLNVKSYEKADLKGTQLSDETIHFVVVDDEENRNLAPVLVKPPVELFAKVGTPFARRLPDSTFVDPDGVLTSFVMTGLPDGLKGDGALISGTPTKKGIFTVKVRVTDNGGGASETTFKFTVSADNLPPVANGTIPDQTAPVNKPFSYTIAESLFNDPDGSIASVIVLGLPEGLTNSGRNISGTPTKAGKYQLVAVARDNADATVQLIFNLTISDENRPPLVAKAINDQVADSNAVYRFVIPAGTFVDTDGKITRLEISGLPAGLSAQGDTISGRPTEVGEFNVVVKAFDDKGASVQLTFKLTVYSNRPPLVAKAISDQVADSNAVYRFVIPAGTFVDTDGKIARLEISGLPTGLSAQGDTISGRPTQVGEYSVSVRAFDDKGASTQLTFKLTVYGNRPPLVAKAINDQMADSNAVYRFVIPAGTFVDTDGKIARLKISGLPAGLSAQGDTISGRPTQVGEFVITVQAFDDKNSSTQLTFKLTVRGVNTPPVVQPVPDLLAIMGQIFRFDVKEYFKDSDGAIASISYASALPPGITANGSLLAGNPTAVGNYPMKVIAQDNKGASVTVEFMLRVERAELHVLLYESGQQPKKIREISNADIIAISTLPPSLELYVESNADIDLMSFELTGPTSRKSTDELAPFGLYSDGSGFSPQVGTYKLKVTAYRNNTVVTTRSIQFDIIKANNTPVRLGVEENEVFPTADLWKAYPNPFVDIVKVQMDGNDFIPKAVEVVSVAGKSTLLDQSKWRVEHSLLEVNLTEAATRSGIYLLRITGPDGKPHTVRIMKSERK